jgi:phosphoglycerol transferase MdoB-like AlkP superfamily enzyme
VYPKLGFDSVLFREEFGEVGKYDQRPYATDEFCYSKMVEDYETMGDGPRLQYILTIQNHGGWELNPKESDIVNCLTDFGDYTDDMSEYLSCIKKTDEAFKKLTEYYESIDRDVIVCMVGDHAPSFATELVKDFSLENTFALRSTPYVIWSNFDIDTKDIPVKMSMPYLVPTVLDAAGVSLSPYYSQMLKLREEVPVLSAFGVYRTKKGETFRYSENTEYSNDIDIYFNMVYNNVAEAATRIDSIFDPQRNN